MSGNSNKNELTDTAKKAFATAFGGIIAIMPEEGNPIWIDGRNAPKVLAACPEHTAADCTWRGNKEALIRILTSERALESAYISGRVSISGNMSVMARLQLKGSR